MSCISIEVDTCGFGTDEVERILNHLLNHHEKVVSMWIEDQISEGRICKKL